jgi:hypothetical protein
MTLAAEAWTSVTGVPAEAGTQAFVLTKPPSVT